MAGGSTAGTSVPMSQFFVATPADTGAQPNAALAQGCNLFFTPGVYNINQTLNVTNPNTVVLGIGMPTLIPVGGVNTRRSWWAAGPAGAGREAAWRHTSAPRRSWNATAGPLPGNDEESALADLIAAADTSRACP